ncbi:hypothetical protein [Streptomyces sp. NPDC053069]|uniref:hypothetical protein n=1 Tax=Streptomyces sp. NPDC053069 TaxID=3365695 RepID=UPI0037CDBF4D
MRRGPLKPAVSADRVRAALMEARPAGLRFPHLVAATELSPWQARRGLGLLRDIAVEEHLTADHLDAGRRVPLRRGSGRAGSPRTGDLPAEAERVRPADHWHRRPAREMDPDDEWVQLVLAQLNGIKAALDMLVKFRRTPGPRPRVATSRANKVSSWSRAVRA